MASIQQTYQINPAIGFPGELAEPNSPMRVEQGTLYLGATDGRFALGARPGDAVYYDRTNNGWRVAYDSSSQLAIEGILTYRADAVAGGSDEVRLMNGDQVFVVTMGVVWIVAGGASERGAQLLMHFDDWKYDNLTRVTAVADIYRVPIQNFNTAPAVDNAIIKAAIGYGRAI